MKDNVFLHKGILWYPLCKKKISLEQMTLKDENQGIVMKSSGHLTLLL